MKNINRVSVKGTNVTALGENKIKLSFFFATLLPLVLLLH
jgi:hypothetical protein